MTPSFPTGTADNQWDDPTEWQTAVGATITADATAIGIPFGVGGKEFLAGAIALSVMGAVLIVVGGTGGMGALGAVLLCVPIIWIGTQFKIMPIAIITIMCAVFALFFIRQFFWKTL